MKSKQREELKSKSIQALKDSVKESKDLIFKLRIEKSQNKMKNLKSIFFERKKIAFMLTNINEKLKLEKIEKEKKESEIKPKSKKKDKVNEK